jgi:hypothetical protein
LGSLVADGRCGVAEPVVGQLRGDVGAGDGHADLVGAEETVPLDALGGSVLGALKRTTVQVMPLRVMMSVMPSSSW